MNIHTIRNQTLDVWEVSAVGWSCTEIVGSGLGISNSFGANINMTADPSPLLLDLGEVAAFIPVRLAVVIV
jgi:hypothetical protein